MREAVWFLAMPSSVLTLLLAAAWLAAWAARARVAAALALIPLGALALLALVPVDELLARPLEARFHAPDPMPARVDGVVVLGGAVDDRVSRARGQLTLNDAGERLWAGVALARRYPEATLVFTGAYADVLTLSWPGIGASADPVAAALAGHPVHTVGAARSTYEEARLALEAARPAPGSTWLLVTSALHMPRAHATFATAGWSTVPYPVDYRSAGGAVRVRLAWPGARLASLDTVVREWGAWWVYRRSGRIQDPEAAARAR